MNGAVTDKLRRLARFQETRSPFVSVYLDLKNDSPDKKGAIRIFLKNGIRDAQELLDGRADRGAFEADADRILRFVDDEQNRAHSGEGAAIFSCSGEDVFETIHAKRPFQNQFLVSNRPLIRQLAVFLDEYEAVVAVVIDRRSARIFEISLGGGVQETGVSSEVPRESKVPEFHGWGDLKYQRDVRGHIEHHYRDVAFHVTHLVDDERYRRIVVLGQDAIVQNFRKLLPKRVAERVIATGPADKREGVNEILARVNGIVAQEEKRQERELIALIRDQALSGNLGVFGLEATLNALAKGQVYKLAIADDLSARGYRCRSCTALSAHTKKDACPYCGNGVDPTELGDEIVKDALAQGAEIETVRNSPDLVRMGKIGALLRFRD